MSGIASTLGLSASDNYSVLSIPFYYLLALLPHVVAGSVGSASDGLSRWDNRNPRADELRATLKARLSAERYSTYQRAEAAHYNSIESMPLYLAAIVLGNMTRVPKAELNDFVVTAALLRTAYIIAYINTSQQKYTAIRSVIWFAQVGVTLRLIWTAGKALM